jgi:non-ribosomal peptide synthetase component F
VAAERDLRDAIGGTLDPGGSEIRKAATARRSRRRTLVVYLLQHLAETSAERSPDAPAVILNDLAYTYAELERAANRLANALIAQGVRRGDRVGMFLAKSIWSIVSIQAIHKAGAAYVPLDPNAPAARARYIIAAAGIGCLITEKARLARLIEPAGESPALNTVMLVDEGPLPSLAHARVLSLREVLEHGRDTRPAVTGIWNDLAYIL